MNEIPRINFINRQKKLLNILVQEKLDSALIVKPENVFYLTNFKGTFSYLLINVKRKKPLLLTDNRYYELATKKAQNCQVELIKSEGLEELANYINEFESKRISLEADFLTIDFGHKLRKILEKKDFVEKISLVEKVRMIKEPEEVKIIQLAAKLNDQVLSKIIYQLKPGLSEKEIALEIDYQVRKKGGDNVGFEIIVASGPNSAIPHAQVTDRRIQNGDLVKIDFGAVVKGYCSDITRTVVVGEAKKWQKDIFRTVVESSKRALTALTMGVELGKVDKTVRTYFKEEELAEFFGHNLGHGVGLEVHELPVIKSESNEIAQTGMVFTIEPGLYLSGRGGVRHEEMVYLSDEGPVKLSKFTDELIEV